MCAKSGWRCLGRLARTAIAVIFEWTGIADYARAEGAPGPTLLYTADPSIEIPDDASCK